MLPRMLRLPIGTSRRAYSFFSSKPGGGRYFNSAKPHKVAPTSATASSGKANVKSEDGAPSPPPSSPASPEDIAMKKVDEPDAPPPVSQESPFITRPVAPRLPPHPTFSSHTYPLHNFFSLHRPLLLLPLPTSTLFDPPSSSLNEVMSPPTPSPDTMALQFDESPEPSGDADADAARQLARALALNRVGGWIDWEQTLARLGDIESLQAFEDPVPIHNSDVSMDSTKRKRRKKMSKHKYKKRRRAQRSERRKMGK